MFRMWFYLFRWKLKLTKNNASKSFFDQTNIYLADLKRDKNKFSIFLSIDQNSRISEVFHGLSFLFNFIYLLQPVAASKYFVNGRSRRR